jgi:hypothetical protein
LSPPTPISTARHGRLRRRILVGRAEVHRHPTHLVRDGIYYDFRARLLERIAAGQIGDPCGWQTDAGLLVNQRQFDDVLEGIEYDRPDGIHVAEDRRPSDV